MRLSGLSRALRRRAEFSVGVVAWITGYDHGTSGHVDNPGLTERVSWIALVYNIKLRKRWNLWVGGGWRWSFGGDRRWCRGTRNPKAYAVLVFGGIHAVGLLQVAHLLVVHSDLVDLKACFTRVNGSNVESSYRCVTQCCGVFHM